MGLQIHEDMGEDEYINFAERIRRLVRVELLYVMFLFLV